MKSYCTFSIRLNRLKKGGGTTEYILFIFFLKSHFNRFFLSLHSVLSLLSVLYLRFLLKHETGLGFSLRLETLAWWWLTAWWLIGGLGLRSRRGGSLGLPISVWWWLGPAHAAGHTAKERPTPLATPRRRDPPHWPRRKGETHPAGHAKPCRADPNGLEVVEPCRSRPGGVSLALEVVEPCQLVAEKLILVAEKLI